jgi:hypothetical protein
MVNGRGPFWFVGDRHCGAECTFRRSQSRYFATQTHCSDVSLLQAGVPVDRQLGRTQLMRLNAVVARNPLPEWKCAKPAMHEKGKKRATTEY